MADFNLATSGKEYILGATTGCSTITSAISTIGSTVATLVVPSGSWDTNGQNIPATMTVRVLRGGLLTGTSQFSVYGAIEAGEYQIFAFTGGGYVLFRAASCRNLYVRWWGTAGDGATDDTAAINSAFGSMLNMSATLNFTPGDTHLVGNVTWTVSGANPAEAGQIVRFNGVKFKSNKSSSADILSIVNLVNQQIKLEGPVEFYGFSSYVWSKTGTGAVASLYFNQTNGQGVAGTARGSLLLVQADKDWYYDAGADTLYIYVVAGVYENPNNFNVPEARYPYIQIGNAGSALTGWTKYFGGSAVVSELANFSIDMVHGRGVDKVLYLKGGEVGAATNITGSIVNTVVNCTTYASNKPAGLFFKNLRGQITFSDILVIDSGDSVVVDGIATDFASGRIANIADVEAISLRNTPLEVTGYGGVVTEAFLFNNCKGIDIDASLLTQGTYDVESVSNVGRILYFENGCGGVSVRSCQIVSGSQRVGPDNVYFYDHDGTLGGMTVTGCYIEGALCQNATPAATFTDCSYNGTTQVIIPMSHVVKVDARSLTNYAANPISDSSPGLTGCTYAQATGLGGANTAGQITWTNTTNSADFVALFNSPASGSLYGIMSFKFKGSIAQRVGVSWLKTGSVTYTSGGFQVAADGVWRTCFIPGPINNFGTYPTVAELIISSNVGSGTFTIDDDIQIYWFSTRGEAESFVGKYGTIT